MSAEMISQAGFQEAYRQCPFLGAMAIEQAQSAFDIEAMSAKINADLASAQSEAQHAAPTEFDVSRKDEVTESGEWNMPDFFAQKEFDKDLAHVAHPVSLEQQTSPLIAAIQQEVIFRQELTKDKAADFSTVDEPVSVDKKVDTTVVHQVAAKETAINKPQVLVKPKSLPVKNNQPVRTVVSKPKATSRPAAPKYSEQVTAAAKSPKSKPSKVSQKSKTIKVVKEVTRTQSAQQTEAKPRVSEQKFILPVLAPKQPATTSEKNVIKKIQPLLKKNPTVSSNRSVTKPVLIEEPKPKYREKLVSTSTFIPESEQVPQAAEAPIETLEPQTITIIENYKSVAVEFDTQLDASNEDKQQANPSITFDEVKQAVAIAEPSKVRQQETSDSVDDSVDTVTAALVGRLESIADIVITSEQVIPLIESVIDTYLHEQGITVITADQRAKITAELTPIVTKKLDIRQSTKAIKDDGTHEIKPTITTAIRQMVKPLQDSLGKIVLRAHFAELAI